MALSMYVVHPYEQSSTRAVRRHLPKCFLDSWWPVYYFNPEILSNCCDIGAASGASSDTCFVTGTKAATVNICTCMLSYIQLCCGVKMLSSICGCRVIDTVCREFNTVKGVLRTAVWVKTSASPPPDTAQKGCALDADVRGVLNADVYLLDNEQQSAHVISS